MSQQPIVCTRRKGNCSQGHGEHQPHSGHWSGEEEMRFLVVLEELEGSTTALGREAFT